MKKIKRQQTKKQEKKRLKKKKSHSARLEKRRRTAAAEERESEVFQPSTSQGTGDRPEEYPAPEGYAAVSSNRVFFEISRSIVTPLLDQGLEEQTYADILEAARLAYQASRRSETSLAGENVSAKTKEKACSLLSKVVAVDNAAAVFDSLVLRAEELFPSKLQGQPFIYVMKRSYYEPLVLKEFKLTEQAERSGEKQSEHDKRFLSLLDDFYLFWRAENKRCFDDEGLDEFLQNFKEETGREYDESKDGLLENPEFDYDVFEEKRTAVIQAAGEAYLDWLKRSLESAEAAATLGKTASELLPVFLEYAFDAGDIVERNLTDLVVDDLDSVLFSYALNDIFDTPQGYLRWPDVIRFFFYYLHELGLVKHPSSSLAGFEETAERFRAYIFAQYGKAVVDEAQGDGCLLQ